MKLINSSFEIIEQRPGLEGMWKHVEKCARTAYKSENYITENSYVKFCDMLKERGHLACFEQGTVYLEFKNTEIMYISLFKENPYSFVTETADKTYITTNMRVIHECDLYNVLSHLCAPTEHHVYRITVKIICSRSISHEIVRHRAFSFIQESQRYCRYSSSKFNSEITYIIPQWVHDIRFNISNESHPMTKESYKYLLYLQDESWLRELTTLDRTVATWYDSLSKSEADYIFMTTTDESCKLQPQEARSILPNDCKTEVCITGTILQWKEFFRLRCAKDAHPDMQRIAIPLKEEFINRGYICTE